MHLEKSDGIAWKLSYRGNTHDVVFKFCSSYVIADIKGQNKLCAHYNTHGEYIKRLCHDCNCPTEHGDDPFFPCEPVNQKDIQKLIDANDEGGLQQISQHLLQNAMHKLSFGNSKAGIYGANPPDPLHTLELGLNEYLCTSLSDQMGKASMSRIDSIIQIMSKFCEHQSDRNMPRTNFPKGLSNLSRLSGSEMPGVLLSLLIALSCDAGKSIALQSPTFSSDSGRKFCRLIQGFLGYQAWLDQDVVTEEEVCQLTDRLSALLSNMKGTIKRKEGLGLKIPKFHLQMHMERYIRWLGSAKNWNAKASEEDHKYKVKEPGKRTQKRQATLSVQAAQQVADNMLIYHACSELIHWDRPSLVDNPSVRDESSSDCITGGGSRAILSTKLDSNGNPISLDLCWSTKPPKVSYDADLMKFVAQKCANIVPDGKVHLFTEWKDKSRSLLLRAHPCYRQDRSWNDWAVFLWEDHGSYLGCIQCFVNLTVSTNSTIESGMYAVVHSVTQPVTPQTHNKNVLAKFKLEPFKEGKAPFELVPVAAIESSAFVVPNLGGSHGSVFYVCPRRNWPQLFMT